MIFPIRISLPYYRPLRKEAEMDNAAYDPWQALFEIFSKPMNPVKGCGRTYVLEFIAGQPVFRPTEFDLAFDSAMEEAFGPADGNEIVPEKLARCFPSPSQRPPQFRR